MTAFDTNILIYACNRADPVKQRTALDLLSSAEDGVLLWQVACEFVAASRKLAKHGFQAGEAWARLSEFMNVLPLILPSPNVLAHARELHLRNGWSFWDAMIVAACLDAGIHRIYTEDLPGSAPDQLEIVNPFADPARE